MFVRVCLQASGHTYQACILLSTSRCLQHSTWQVRELMLQAKRQTREVCSNSCMMHGYCLGEGGCGRGFIQPARGVKKAACTAACTGSLSCLYCLCLCRLPFLHGMSCLCFLYALPCLHCLYCIQASQLLRLWEHPWLPVCWRCTEPPICQVGHHTTQGAPAASSTYKAHTTLQQY